MQFETNPLIPLLFKNSLETNEKNQLNNFSNNCEKTITNSNKSNIINQQYLTTLSNIFAANNQKEKEINNNLTKNYLNQQQLQNILKAKNFADLNNDLSKSKLTNLFLNNYSRVLSNQMLLLNKFQQPTSNNLSKVMCDSNFSIKENGNFFDEINNIDNQNDNEILNLSNNEDNCSETFSEKSDEIEHDEKNLSINFIQLLQQQLKNKILNNKFDFSFTTPNSAGFTISEILSAVNNNKESLINNE